MGAMGEEKGNVLIGWKTKRPVYNCLKVTFELQSQKTKSASKKENIRKKDYLEHSPEIVILGNLKQATEVFV